MGKLITGQTIMMTLGGFRFGLSTAAYNELKRASAYRWPTQERFGQRPSAQFTGLGEETINLSGVIFPEYRGGTGQVDAMRAAAAAGQTLKLVAGTGAALGDWVIEKIDEGQTVFAADGVPRRQEFSLSLKRVPTAGATGLVNGVAAVASGLVDSSAAGQVASLANNMLNSSAQVSAGLGTSLVAVQQNVVGIGAQAQATITAVRRAADAAASIRSAASSAIDAVQRVRSSAGALSAASQMLSSAETIARQATRQSDVLKTISGGLTVATNGTPAVKAVEGALVSANKATALAASMRYQAERLVRSLS